MATFHVYSRQGCHLCEVMIEALLPLLRGQADVEIHDVDTSPALQDEYGTRVPVLEFAGQAVCQYHLDRQAVIAALDEIAGRPE